MDISKKNHIIFDMDGLLIDTESVYLEGWKQAFKEANTNIPSEVANEMTGQSIKHNSELVYSYVKDWNLVQELRDMRYNYFERELQKGNVNTMPYAVEFLKLLKSKGYQLSLCTSTYEERAKKLLDHFKLEEYFSNMLFGDSVKQTKPNPDIYLTALEKANKSAEDSLVFEDSTIGATAATNALIDTVMITNPNDVNEFSNGEKERYLIAVYDSLKEPMDFFN